MAVLRIKMNNKICWRMLMAGEAIAANYVQSVLLLLLNGKREKRSKDLPWPSLCLRRQRMRDRKKWLKHVMFETHTHTHQTDYETDTHTEHNCVFVILINFHLGTLIFNNSQSHFCCLNLTTCGSQPAKWTKWRNLLSTRYDQNVTWSFWLLFCHF